MPYESMVVGGSEPGAGAPRQDPSQEPPGRTPKTAESGGQENEGRRMPQGEPGKTPGSAEGEDPDSPPRK
ncbi:hypothetical protein G4177_23450 [Corallococcus sp. ZKHCc1 1396]|uniref:Uncharacterized protein n=1 Tax=Corallococcus soli TaxID=2710757 RepID=A0ABR9PTB2_9BACT|nr:hypothetical protein [Corallococcus soli]MBE4751135.1 hypothetical protein [Corallococcus soli]